MLVYYGYYGNIPTLRDITVQYVKQDCELWVSSAKQPYHEGPPMGSWSAGCAGSD